MERHVNDPPIISDQPRTLAISLGVEVLPGQDANMVYEMVTRILVQELAKVRFFASSSTIYDAPVELVAESATSSMKKAFPNLRVENSADLSSPDDLLS